MKSMNLTQVPFSTAGAYLAISYHGENFRGQQNREGLYLRTIHHTSHTPFVCRMAPMVEGKEVPFTYDEQPAELVLTTDYGKVRFCFGDAETILIQGEGAVGLRLDFLAEFSTFNLAYEVPVEGKTFWMANAFKNNSRFLLQPQEGRLEARQDWEEEYSKYLYLDLLPEEGRFLTALQEIFVEWDGVARAWDYETAKAAASQRFEAFYQSMPTVPAEFEDARRVASYVNYASIVKKNGFLPRDTMLMSKNWMAKVWSWDHCFNAIALSYHNPQAAFDQFILPFDQQNDAGGIPDSITDGELIWNYCKPPIHGWALEKMMEQVALTNEQLWEAYHRLTRWTNWWLNNRDRDHNGLCEYTHGNDSGWDNSTAFSKLPPVQTPDLQAFLVLQMETLAKLARKLHRLAEADSWQEKSERMLIRMLEDCFDENGMPLSKRAYTGEIIETQSLILYLPVILGKRLPEKIRKNLVRELKSERFLTEWGFATESPQSPYYVPDGYWRGPIWAPSTMLLLDGLWQCGETELVREAAARFARMIQKSGCAENFDAKTGEGLRDRAYTWTSSAFLVMSHEYLQQ